MNPATRILAFFALTLLVACGGDSAAGIARNDDVFALADTNVVREQITTQTIRSGGVVDSMSAVSINRQLEPRFTTFDIYLTQDGEVSEMQIARNEDFFMTRTANSEWVHARGNDVRLPSTITALLDARVREADLDHMFEYGEMSTWNSRTLHSYTGSLEAAKALLPSVTVNAHKAEVTMKLDEQGFVVQMNATIDYPDRILVITYELVDIEDPILSMGS
ncbi:MAG: hypothetical protein HKN07_13840 [Acidimicrobiia bacterium]|nr:hypothetical protein [Acidimicrobiia bacterium]NNF65325.1 hypothetical protein [Acidimicrobiia bacterium]